MSMRQIRKKDIRELNLILTKQNYTYQLNQKSKVNILETSNYSIIIQDDIPIFFSMSSESLYIPTLKLMIENLFLPKVIVDMGAIPFVIKGADIMKPGVVSYPANLNKGDLVVVVDEKHNKPLSISKLLFSSNELNNLNKGKVLNNIHYVNDSIWNMNFD